MLFISFLDPVNVTFPLMPSFLILFLSDSKYLNLLHDIIINPFFDLSIEFKVQISKLVSS